MKKFHPHNVTYKRRHIAKMKRKEEQRQVEIQRMYEDLPPHARMREDGSYFVGSKEYKR